MARMNDRALWDRYRKYLCVSEATGTSLDVSRMTFDEAFLAKMKAPLEKAFSAMDALEKGAIANPDEGRMVGHYWLRAPELAPTKDLRSAIETTLASLK